MLGTQTHYSNGNLGITRQEFNRLPLPFLSLFFAPLLIVVAVSTPVCVVVAGSSALSSIILGRVISKLPQLKTHLDNKASMTASRGLFFFSLCRQSYRVVVMSFVLGKQERGKRCFVVVLLNKTSERALEEGRLLARRHHHHRHQQ